MQTSAKTKAKEFTKWGGLHPDMEDSLRKLLLEHERDTRYTAIDILHAEDAGYCNNDGDEMIKVEDAISKIHNLKVGS